MTQRTWPRWRCARPGTSAVPGPRTLCPGEPRTATWRVRPVVKGTVRRGAQTPQLPQPLGSGPTRVRAVLGGAQPPWWVSRLHPREVALTGGGPDRRDPDLPASAHSCESNPRLFYANHSVILCDVVISNRHTHNEHRWEKDQGLTPGHKETSNKEEIARSTFKI